MGADVFWLIATIINLFELVVFIYVILSWLIQFSVINPYNQFVSMVIRITQGLVEPVLAPIRRVLPLIGGLDLSPLVLLLGLEFAKRILLRLLVTGF